MIQKRMSKFRFSMMALLLLSSFVCHQALAYIPPAWFVVKSVAAKKKGFKTLRVRSRIQSLDLSENVLIREVFTVDYGAGKATSKLYTDSGDEILVKESRAWQGAGLGSLLSASGRVELLSEVLKSLKLPLKYESELLAQKGQPSPEPEAIFLSRYLQSVVWTLGRKGEEPQLLIEKDTFLPLRWIGDVDGKKVDYQFEKYRSVRELSYPEQMTVFLGDRGYRVIADEIAVNIETTEPKSAVRAPAAPVASHLMDAAKSWHRWYR